MIINLESCFLSILYVCTSAFTYIGVYLHGRAVGKILVGSDSPGSTRVPKGPWDWGGYVRYCTS